MALFTPVVVPPSPGWVLLQVVSAVASASVQLDAITATYDNYRIVGSGIRPNTSAADLKMLFKIGGSYSSSAFYDTESVEWYSVDGNSVLTGATSAMVNRTGQSMMSNAAAYALSLECILPSPASATQTKSANGTFASNGSGGNSRRGEFSTVYTSGVLPVTGVQFNMTSGTMDGNFLLYGLKKVIE